MTTEGVGAYILLLCKSWRENPPGSIPDDDAILARWARLSADRWTECRTGVLAAFSFGTDSRWHQPRLRREYHKLLQSRKEKKEAGLLGAKARWQPHGRPIATALAENAISSSSSISNKNKIPKPTPAASPPVPDWIHEPTWFAFVKMRKKIRAELTDHAIELTFKDLEMLKNQGHDPKAVLEQSIKQGWRGVFELRTVRGHGGSQTPEERMQQNLRNSGLDSEGNYIPRRVV